MRILTTMYRLYREGRRSNRLINLEPRVTISDYTIDGHRGVAMTLPNAGPVGSHTLLIPFGEIPSVIKRLRQVYLQFQQPHADAIDDGVPTIAGQPSPSGVYLDGRQHANRLLDRIQHLMRQQQQAVAARHRNDGGPITWADVASLDCLVEDLAAIEAALSSEEPYARARLAPPTEIQL